MAKLLSNNYMLWLDGVTTGTYALIRGQGNLGISRSAAKIDLTSKDDGNFGVSAPGIKELTLDLDVLPNLPDVTGYTRLETLSNASPQLPVLVQIRKGGASGTPTDVVFQCLMYSNLDSTAHNQNAGATVKVSFYAAAAPTVDVLA